MLVLQLRETRTPRVDLRYCLVLDVGSSYQRFSVTFEGGRLWRRLLRRRMDGQGAIGRK